MTATATAQQTQVLQVIEAMFGAAPGATLLAAGEEFLTAYPSTETLAQVLSGTTVFYGTSYSASLAPAQFADTFVSDLIGSRASTADKASLSASIVTQMTAGASQYEMIAQTVKHLSSLPPEDAAWGAAATYYNTSVVTKILDNLVGTTAAAADKTVIVDVIVGLLGDGLSLGRAVELLTTALDGVVHTDATWGNAAALFDNRIEVATYYSLDKAGTATDVGTLQQALAGVTDAASSVTSAKAVFDNPMSGMAQDGYLSGATVFVDMNGDGVLNTGEVSVTSDAQGNFTLPAGTFGSIVATGGTDIATNLPFTGSMSAPAGSAMVTPLTTLMQSMVTSGATVEQAQTQVLTALGLPATVNLQTLDAMAVAVGSGSAADRGAAAQVQAAMSQVANILSLGTAAIQGAASGTSATSAMAEMASALANNFAAATGTVDLTQTATLQSVMTEAAAATSTGAATAVTASLDNIASLMASANTSVDTAMAANPTDFTAAMSQVAKVQVVVQGSMSDSMVTGMAAGSITDTVSSFTGTALDTAVTAAVPGDLTPDVPATGGTPTTPPSGGGGTTPPPDSGGSGGGGDSGGGGGPVTHSLDTGGTFQTPTTFDAASGAGLFNFTDSVAIASFTTISNFAANDAISITGGGSNHLIVANNGADVVLTVNDNGIVSQITLVGVTTASTIIGSLAVFNALSVGDVTYS